MANELICRIDGCNKPIRYISEKLCQGHYLRRMRHGDPLKGGKSLSEKGAPLKWMQEHLGFVGDDCLIFPYGKHSAGYGALVENGKRVLAHRWVCRQVYGPPKGKRNEVAHSCGNGHLGCVNPKHLRWASPSENAIDKVNHGRHNGLNKLQVLEIVRHREAGFSYSNIATNMHTSVAAVTDICLGRSWSWLTGIPSHRKKHQRGHRKIKRQE